MTRTPDTKNEALEMVADGLEASEESKTREEILNKMSDIQEEMKETEDLQKIERLNKALDVLNKELQRI